MIHQYQPNFDWHELEAMLRPGGCREFETALADRVGAKHALAFAYGRSAMIALFKILGLADDEIILPAYTCQVVAEAVVVSGNRPVFVDIDLPDYNMDLAALKNALTSHTRAIIATHMHGYPADIAAIRNLVGDDRIALIEDAALLGPVDSYMKGNAARGDVVIFSFSPGKHLYAVQGGCLATNSDELYEKLKEYRDREMNHSPRKVLSKRLARMVLGYVMLNAPLFELWNTLNRTGPMQRVRDNLGITLIDMPTDYAAVLSDFQARVATVQLIKSNQILAKHRAWAEVYDRELRDVPGLKQPPLVAGATFAHYAPRIERRDEIRFGARMRAKGIEIGTAFQQVVPNLKPYQRYVNHTFPCAEQAAHQVVNLPNYARLRESGIRFIAEQTRQVLED